MKLRDKILSGYAYQIKKMPVPGERNIVLNTGKGGVLMYIDACEKVGIPEEVIAKSITCFTDMGPYTMDVLNVKKKDNDSAGV